MTYPRLDPHYFQEGLFNDVRCIECGLVETAPIHIEPPPATIDERFMAFHAAHPEVYVELSRLARALLARGWDHLGIGMLWETLRYHTMLGSRPGEDHFKLNDHYRSRYARMLMDREPDLDGLFELRRLRTP